jgi:hypothetical protein
MKQPANPLGVINTNIKPHGAQCPQELNGNTCDWDGKRTASSATFGSALKRNARTSLQLDVSFEPQDSTPSLWSPPALCARLLQELRSPRYVPKLLSRQPTSPPSGHNNDPDSSVEDEERDLPKYVTAAPTAPGSAGGNSNDENDIAPKSPSVAKQNRSGGSAVLTPARVTTSHFEGDGDDEDPWRAAAITELTGLNSKLGLFSIEVHQLQAVGEQRSATDTDHHDHLISDIKQDALGKLRSMELGRADDLRQFRDSLVDEAERLLATLDKLKPISLGSPMIVDDPALPEKPTFTEDVHQLSHLDGCEDQSPENRHRNHEMELTEVEKVLKRCDNEVGRLSRINETDLPQWEKYQCSCVIRGLEDALHKLEATEMDIDSNLEVSRTTLMSSTKILITTFQCLRGDDRLHENTEAARHDMENTLQSKPSPASNSSHPADNPLYGGPKTAFTAVFKIPNVLQRVHRQCKAWDAGPPREVTSNSKFKVKWVCEHLIWTSRFVDLIGKVANEDDLKRLPGNLFILAPQKLQDISRVLRALRQDYKLFVDQGLPCARNIQTKLESIHRRKQTYQKWLKGRKVHFPIVVDPPPSGKIVMGYGDRCLETQLR